MNILRNGHSCIILGFIILSLAACGCGPSSEIIYPVEDNNGINDLGTNSDTGYGEDIFLEIDPLSVNGNIVIAGSSAVFPLAERIAERFQDEGFRGNVTVDSIGSGAGFERFCVTGETDIANASRPIKDSERESCEAIGRNPIEFRVGTDALSVVVSKDNDFITEVTLEDIASLFA